MRRKQIAAIFLLGCIMSVFACGYSTEAAASVIAETCPEKTASGDSDASTRTKLMSADQIMPYLTGMAKNFLMDGYRAVYDLPGRLSDALFDHTYRISVEQPALDLLDSVSFSGQALDMSWIKEIGLDIALSDLVLDFPEELFTIYRNQSDSDFMFTSEEEFGARGLLHVNKTPVITADAILGASGLRYWLPDTMRGLGNVDFLYGEEGNILSAVHLIFEREGLLPDPQIPEKILNIVADDIGNLCKMQKVGENTIYGYRISLHGKVYVGYLTVDDLMIVLNDVVKYLDEDPAIAEYIDSLFALVQEKEEISALLEDLGLLQVARTAISLAGYDPAAYLPGEVPAAAETEEWEEEFGGTAVEESGSGQVFDDQRDAVSEQAEALPAADGTAPAPSAVLLQLLHQTLDTIDQEYEMWKQGGEDDRESPDLCIVSQVDDAGDLTALVIRLDDKEQLNIKQVLEFSDNTYMGDPDTLLTYFSIQDNIYEDRYAVVSDLLKFSSSRSAGETYTTESAEIYWGTGSNTTFRIDRILHNDSGCGYIDVGLDLSASYLPVTFITEQSEAGGNSLCDGKIGIPVSSLKRLSESLGYYWTYDLGEAVENLPYSMSVSVNFSEGRLELSDDQKVYLTISPLDAEDSFPEESGLKEDIEKKVLDMGIYFFSYYDSVPGIFMPLPVINRLLDAGMPHEFLNYSSVTWLENLLEYFR